MSKCCHWGIGHSFLSSSEIRSHSQSLSDCPAKLVLASDTHYTQCPYSQPFPRWVFYDTGGKLGGSQLDLPGRGSLDPGWTRAPGKPALSRGRQNTFPLQLHALGHLAKTVATSTDLYSSSQWPKDGHFSLTLSLLSHQSDLSGCSMKPHSPSLVGCCPRVEETLFHDVTAARISCKIQLDLGQNRDCFP